MDQTKTGALIRRLRQKQGMTQLALAERLGVSDKAVSKWERGRGTPDVALLPALSEILGVNTNALLQGTLEENDMTNGNLKHLKFYVCPDCGNLLFSAAGGERSCCGKRLEPLEAQEPPQAEGLTVSRSDGEWYVTSAHEMHRDHYISFLALVNGDTVLVRKLYPEWGLETRLPCLPHSTLLWYCTRHGLFAQKLGKEGIPGKA